MSLSWQFKYCFCRLHLLVCNKLQKIHQVACRYLTTAIFWNWYDLCSEQNYTRALSHEQSWINTWSYSPVSFLPPWIVIEKPLKSVHWTLIRFKALFRMYFFLLFLLLTFYIPSEKVEIKIWVFLFAQRWEMTTEISFTGLAVSNNLERATCMEIKDWVILSWPVFSRPVFSPRIFPR